jgi:hypothetical protein
VRPPPPSPCGPGHLGRDGRPVPGGLRDRQRQGEAQGGGGGRALWRAAAGAPMAPPRVRAVPCASFSRAGRSSLLPAEPPGHPRGICGLPRRLTPPTCRLGPAPPPPPHFPCGRAPRPTFGPGLPADDRLQAGLTPISHQQDRTHMCVCVSSVCVVIVCLFGPYQHPAVADCPGTGHRSPRCARSDAGPRALPPRDPPPAARPRPARPCGAGLAPRAAVAPAWGGCKPTHQRGPGNPRQRCRGCVHEPSGVVPGRGREGNGM